jgi:hypothetical protein
VKAVTGVSDNQRRDTHFLYSLHVVCFSQLTMEFLVRNRLDIDHSFYWHHFDSEKLYFKFIKFVILHSTRSFEIKIDTQNKKIDAEIKVCGLVKSHNIII